MYLTKNGERIATIAPLRPTTTPSRLGSVSPTIASETVFDTSAVIGLAERQSPVLVDIVKDLGQSDRQRTLARYEQLSEWSEIEASLDAVGQAYGDVSAMASDNGMALGMNDRWIIAECVTQRARLVTGDRRQARLAELVAASLGDAFEVVITG